MQRGASKEEIFVFEASQVSVMLLDMPFVFLMVKKGNLSVQEFSLVRKDSVRTFCLFFSHFPSWKQSKLCCKSLKVNLLNIMWSFSWPKKHEKAFRDTKAQTKKKSEEWHVGSPHTRKVELREKWIQIVIHVLHNFPEGNGWLWVSCSALWRDKAWILHIRCPTFPITEAGDMRHAGLLTCTSNSLKHGSINLNVSQRPAAGPRPCPKVGSSGRRFWLSPSVPAAPVGRLRPLPPRHMRGHLLQHRHHTFRPKDSNWSLWVPLHAQCPSSFASVCLLWPHSSCLSSGIPSIFSMNASPCDSWGALSVNR